MLRKKGWNVLHYITACSLWWTWNVFSEKRAIISLYGNQWRTERGELGGQNPLPRKFRKPSKIVPNSNRLWKLLKIAEFRTPTPQDVRKKGSKILKLLSVHICFTLAMTNKLVIIINSLKVPKIKKILLYEMKFLVPNCSCLQNPWLGGYRPQIPVLSVLNWICWTPQNKIPGYATDGNDRFDSIAEMDCLLRGTDCLSVTTPVHLCTSKGIWHRYV